MVALAGLCAWGLEATAQAAPAAGGGIVKRVVVEEFTGTQCPNCPRGLAGMAKLSEKFGDRFIGIALHNYPQPDPMVLGSYVILGFDGAPECLVDRGENILDPYYGSDETGDIVTDVQRALEVPATVGVEVQGKWNADYTRIEATATLAPQRSGDYSLEYVLVADGLTGTSGAWLQTNNLAARSASFGMPDDIAQFCAGGKYGQSRFQWEFDDVAIGSSYRANGFNQFFIDPLTAGKPFTHTWTLNMPTDPALLATIKPEKVSVIALVVREDGSIDNAAKFTMPGKGGVTAGVERVKSEGEKAEVARYTADGRQISRAERGLNIVKYADGTVRKEWVNK